MSRRRLGLLARLVVSLGLLWFLIDQAGVQQIMTSLSELRLWALGGIFLVILLDNFLRSVNWRLILATRSVRASICSFFSSLLVGGFFGSFIPSSLGPDLARAITLSRREGISLEQAGSSVVMLNLTGLWALGAVVLDRKSVV